MADQISFLQTSTETYFAALNSSCGFVSFFSEVFSPHRLSRVVILKGGPGTGKSTLLRRFAREAEQMGVRAVRFLCSSDPSSLDGVLLPEKGVAVLDGTAPHSVEPSYPGVTEELFDLGVFWDDARLKEKKGELFDLVRQKKEAYRSAYRMLGIAGEFASEEGEIVSAALQREKMLAAVERQLRAVLPQERKGTPCHRQVTAFGGDGEVMLDTFFKSARVRVCVSDDYGVGGEYLSCIRSVLEEHALCYFVSVDPLCPKRCESLFLPQSRTLFTVGEQREGYYVSKRVNMRRFLEAALLRERRTYLRFLSRSAEEAKEESARFFEAARLLHATLEEAYIPTMDFDALTARWNEKQRELLSQ